MKGACAMPALGWSATDLSLWLAPLVVAPFVGSFLGVLIVRLPVGRPVVAARSACENCGTPLTAFDLIPLASYIVQGGRCRHCGARIAPFHVAIELGAIAVAVWVLCAETNPDRVWIDCMIGWTLLTLACIDWRWMLLPDVLTLPLLLAGLMFTLLSQSDAVALHAAAAAAGYFGIRAIAWLYRLARGRDGMGGGDAKLFGAAGAWLGPGALPALLLLAAMLGIVVAGALAISGRRVSATTALPFGSCIAVAFWVLWLHGGEMAWLV
jgi:leader peptidase (prepilin peptidase) / N-methyltransferase